MMMDGQANDVDDRQAAVDEAFAQACARASERAHLELARLDAQRQRTRSQLGVSAATMEQWTREHQLLLERGELAPASLNERP